MANKSIEELVKLATEGNLQATYELGNRYYTGNGVKQDYKMAIDYFRKAEEIGNKNGSYGYSEVGCGIWFISIRHWRNVLDGL